MAQSAALSASGPTPHLSVEPAAVTNPRLMVALFVVLLIPASFYVGPLRLSPSRILLLATFVPSLARVVSGRAGRFTFTDKLMLAYSAWMVLALVVVHGVARLPFATITIVELLGGYLLGRTLVRNAADFRLVFRIHLWTLLFLLPFALYETKTGTLVIPSILRHVAESIYRAKSAYGRIGLQRVYTVFEHPILYGLYCSAALANLFVIFDRPAQRIRNYAFVVLMTFFSLSSAPLLSLGLQTILLSWNWVMKGRWKLLLILSAFGYVTLDALSNRTPITILIDTLTFKSSTGWIRIAINEYGWAAVTAHPFFGIGFNDWPRPFWLTSSVDNFWLLTAMRYGMVGGGLLVAAFLFQLLAVARGRPPGAAGRYKIGYCIALVGIVFSLATVAIWGAASVFIMFYLGAGACFYCGNDPLPREDGEPLAEPVRGPARYSRFPGRSGRPSAPQRPPPELPAFTRISRPQRG